MMENDQNGPSLGTPAAGAARVSDFMLSRSPAESAAQSFDTPAGRASLESESLPGYVQASRWFGGKARQPRRFVIEESIALAEGDASRLILLKVEYAQGQAETYLLPLKVEISGNGEGVIARLSDGLHLADALHDAAFRANLLRLILDGGAVSLPDGLTVAGMRGSAAVDAACADASRVLAVEQSNSSLIFGEAIFMKLYRKIEAGMNPDVEITRYLRERRHFPHVPPFVGSIELHQPGKEARVLALALGMVANKGDAWATALGEVAAFYDRVLSSGANPGGVSVPEVFSDGNLPEPLAALLGAFPARARLLGTRTGQMHAALAEDVGDPAFAPEAICEADLQEIADGIARLAADVIESIERTGAGASNPLVRRVHDALADLGSGQMLRSTSAMKTRTHGDYHLGQVLDTGVDFVLIDFEGEPQRSLTERQQKRSPLRDVAGMLRSFHYAAHSVLNDRLAQRPMLEPWAELWTQSICHQFVQGCREAAADARFLPGSSSETQELLSVYLLEKAIYEVKYELNNRPGWVNIPALGILQILGRAEP